MLKTGTDWRGEASVNLCRSHRNLFKIPFSQISIRLSKISLEATHKYPKVILKSISLKSILTNLFFSRCCPLRPAQPLQEGRRHREHQPARSPHRERQGWYKGDTHSAVTFSPTSLFPSLMITFMGYLISFQS